MVEIKKEYSEFTEDLQKLIIKFKNSLSVNEMVGAIEAEKWFLFHAILIETLEKTYKENHSKIPDSMKH